MVPGVVRVAVWGLGACWGFVGVGGVGVVRSFWVVCVMVWCV